MNRVVRIHHVPIRIHAIYSDIESSLALLGQRQSAFPAKAAGGGILTGHQHLKLCKCARDNRGERTDVCFGAVIDIPRANRLKRSEERRVGKECRSRWS